MREIVLEMETHTPIPQKVIEIQMPVKYFYALKSITQLHEQVRWKTYRDFLIIFPNIKDDHFKNNP